MGTRADELKAEIEETRADLSGTMDQMGERVRPGKIVARRTGQVRQRLTALRHTVMGAPDDPAAGDPASAQQDTTGSALDTARQVPQTVMDGTQGNPLAAGLIAFGAGLLLASVLPGSEAEQHAATQMLNKAQPAIDEVSSAAQQTASDLKETISGAAQELGSAASGATDAVREQAKSGAEEVRSTTSNAARGGTT